MSNIKNINDGYQSSEVYRQRMADTVDKLSVMEQELHKLIVGLAVSGKWKEWSDKQPVGTQFNFTEEMLKDTGDKNVDELAGLIDEVIRVKEQLENRSS